MRRSSFLIIFLFLFFTKSFSQGSTDFEISKNLDIYSSVFKQLYLHYVDEIQSGDLNKKAIDAMLQSLDPYTNYYAESDIEDVRYMRTGKYGGVGAAIHKQNDTIVVGSVLKDYPFYLAGIRAGDKLLAADGLSLIGKTTGEMSEILKGNAGSSLKITVLNNKTKEVKIIDVERAEIKILNVPFYGMVDGGFAFIKLAQFNETAAAEVGGALADLMTTNKVNGLILDLRDNGGGLLMQAVEIMDLFLPPNLPIVETKGKVKAENQKYTTRKPAIYPDLPVVVLVNGRSASASEIVAGAFQDYDRGVILGQKSYGKGLVQKVYPLSFNSQMKITVAKYYIPSGRCIQEINYASHDASGKAIKIADSLQTDFKTIGGRPVKDAGGILPDIHLEKDYYAPIVFDIAQKHLLFNYATEYVNSHDSIKDIMNFQLSDLDFNNFLTYLNSMNYKYESQAILLIQKLSEDSTLINNDSIKSELEGIKIMLHAINQTEIFNNKSDILNLLEQEIIARYFFDYGKIEKGLLKDKSVIEASMLMSDNVKYKKILSVNH